MTRASALFLPAAPGTPAQLRTRADAEALTGALARAREVLASRSVLELAPALGRVGRRFLDPGDPVRLKATEGIAAEAGLSAAAAAAIVTGMARGWTPEGLGRMVRADFPDPLVLDGFRPAGFGGRLRAVGGRFAVHIGAGSVPGVSATSMIRSLLVKCPVLLKPGRGDPVLASLFAQALAASDAELARAVAIVYWPGGEGGPLEEHALATADRVVAYGSLELIRLLRRRIPPATPLVAYHHRLSAGGVARECAEPAPEAGSVLRAAARAVATFEQRGCVSPRIIWIEEGGAVSPPAWAAQLLDALDSVAEELPPGTASLPAAVARRQERERWMLREAAGTGHRIFSGSPGGPAVLYEPDPFAPLRLPATGRTVVVRPIECLSRLPLALRPGRSILQTFALAAPPGRIGELAEILAASGVRRVASFEEQPWPPAWWRHDGTGPLHALVSWASAP